MNRAETIITLKRIIKPYTKDQDALDTLTEKTDFISDLKINSANLVDIILDIEEEFNIEIDNQSMEKMLDVAATLLIIETKLSKK